MRSPVQRRGRGLRDGRRYGQQTEQPGNLLDGDLCRFSGYGWGAAGQGDAREDDEQAIRVLDAGLFRHPDAPPADRFEAILYRAELKLRAGHDAASDLDLAQALLETHTLGDVAEQRLAELRQSTP
jgi:hypothetical protein